MNFLILISFIVIIGMCIVLLMPRKVALRICGINRYDLPSVPYKCILSVVIIASVLLMVFTGVLIYEVKDITTPLPEFISNILEWING